MSGIYFHIPFCKQACNYCDFHFSTSLKLKDKMLAAMMEELKRNKDFLGDKKINSIYFGGGSPSILSISDLEMFFRSISDNFNISKDVEITLEANPDDLNKSKLTEYASLGINRLSIGIQSFRDEDLKLMNRAHNSEMAKNSIKWALEAGISNLTLDLIYGIPGLALNQWQENLETFFEYDTSHLSAYNLTIEDKTAFGHWVKKGTLTPAADEDVIQQFQLLMSLAKKHKYEHYEISNFCKEGFQSRHNTSYWQGKKYLGIGPSAHSFDGKKRRWNMKNNPLYIKAIENNAIYFEEEELSQSDRFNEYILTSLRTKWGVNLNYLELTFNKNWVDSLIKEAQPYLSSSALILSNNILLLTEKGKLVADKITSDLFIV